jgi:cell division transport system permease protein
VATLPGVADVRYDRAWLARVGTGLDSLRRAGLVLALLMAVAAAVTVAAVVRLGLHARREELEIMQLVGASMAFIRGPFVAEGLLQGGIGAAVALLLLWGGYAASSASWGSQLAEALEGLNPEFLPARFCALLVAGGMAVGGAGGFAASRHAV